MTIRSIFYATIPFSLLLIVSWFFIPNMEIMRRGCSAWAKLVIGRRLWVRRNMAQKIARAAIREFYYRQHLVGLYQSIEFKRFCDRLISWIRCTISSIRPMSCQTSGTDVIFKIASKGRVMTCDLAISPHLSVNCRWLWLETRSVQANGRCRLSSSACLG
jgi:Fe-S-cluster containining protein